MVYATQRTSGPETSPRETRDTPRATVWVGCATVAWAFVFAGVSFYWASGGTVGVSTIGPAITKPVLAHDPAWIALLWVTVVLKVLVGLLALALVQPWGQRVPRRPLLVVAWGACLVMALYEGAASWIQHGLMAAGVIGVPSGLGMTALRWHLLLWDPWWLVGGLLLGVAAWGYARSTARTAADSLGRG
jgi:hypothetical protein